MAYCKNCGSELKDGAEFCEVCGQAALHLDNRTGQSQKRTMIYEGAMYKCPNCGEVKNAFDIRCPACGYEFRDAHTSEAVGEFYSKIEALEKEGDYSGKLNLIKSFPVPNTKEDIFEFLLMAMPNINPQVFLPHSASGAGASGMDVQEKAVAEAWMLKSEQLLQKAKISFGNTSEYVQAENVYKEKREAIDALVKQFQNQQNAEKRKIIFVKAAKFLAVAAAAVLIIFLIYSIARSVSNGVQEMNESQRISHLGQIQIGYSSEDFKDEDYYSAGLRLSIQGFSDIRFSPMGDLVTGWTAKDGEVDSVDIEGLSDFHSGDWIDADAVISIAYHSFPKSEKKGFDEGKNNKIIYEQYIFPLPNYFVEDFLDEEAASYHAKGEESTVLKITHGSADDETDFKEYDSHYLAHQEEEKFSNLNAGMRLAMAKKNGQIYKVAYASFPSGEKNDFLRVSLAWLNDGKYEYLSDFEQILKYTHALTEDHIQLTVSAKDVKGEDVEDVKKIFAELGFTDIQTEAMGDIMFGVLAQEGSVEKVTINGDADFKEGDLYAKDDSVLISYHSRK